MSSKLCFHGTKPWNVDWSSESRQLGWMMSSQTDDGQSDTVYVAANSAHYATWFELRNYLKSMNGIFALIREIKLNHI